MKKLSGLLAMIVLMASCTADPIETKNESSTVKKNIQSQINEVDPGTVKPPTHG
jgi:PBP1b-binding outer membrane lipoprotein LpoB